MTGYKLAVEYHEPSESCPFTDSEITIGGIVLFNFESDERNVCGFSKSVLTRFMQLPAKKVQENYSEFYNVWKSGDKYWFRVFKKPDFDLVSELAENAEMSEIMFDHELNSITTIPERANVFDDILETI